MGWIWRSRWVDQEIAEGCKAFGNFNAARLSNALQYLSQDFAVLSLGRAPVLRGTNAEFAHEVIIKTSDCQRRHGTPPLLSNAAMTALFS